MKREKNCNNNEDSVFYLAYCVREQNGNLKCCETINLKNNDYSSIVKLDEYICLIVDNNGNIIQELNKKKSKEENNRIEKILINYVKDNNLIITSINKDNEPLKTSYIHYVRNNIEKRVLYDHNKGGELIYIDLPNEKSDTIVLWRKDKKTLKNDMRLFDAKRGKFVSPSLSKISKTKDKDILMFDDEIESNKEVNGKKYKTVLTGFITLSGIMNNYVYDNEINCVREIGLKPGRLMESYKRFRNKVKNELDFKFEEELQMARKKAKFENNAKSQLKLRIKK
jgi:hypothetical protein